MENSKKEETSTLIMKGNWQNQTKDLQKKFSTLTDADLKFQKDGEEDLIKRVSARLGKDRDEVVTLITKGQN